MDGFFSDLFAVRDRFAVDVIVDTERTPADLIAHIARVVCDPQQHSRRRLYLLGPEDGSDPCMTLPMWAFFGGAGSGSATMMTRVKRLMVSSACTRSCTVGEFTAHVAGQWRHDNAPSGQVLEGVEGMLRTLLRERSPMMSNLLPEGIPANQRNVVIVSDRMADGSAFSQLSGCRDAKLCIPGRDDVIAVISAPFASSSSSAFHVDRRGEHRRRKQRPDSSASAPAAATAAHPPAPRRQAWSRTENDSFDDDSDESDDECEDIAARLATFNAGGGLRQRMPHTSNSIADAMRPVSVSDTENE